MHLFWRSHIARMMGPELIVGPDAIVDQFFVFVNPLP